MTISRVAMTTTTTIVVAITTAPPPPPSPPPLPPSQGILGLMMHECVDGNPYTILLNSP